MRIWSLHPSYLDAKGLVALWRETLLAKHVLEGKTKGYKKHPQLDRFKQCKHPVDAINHYLSFIEVEARARNYNFDHTKINPKYKKVKLSVTTGQLEYEVTHLLKKLKERDKKKLSELKKFQSYNTHPMFTVIEGEIESWEII
jgi:hypothetical protein